MHRFKVCSVDVLEAYAHLLNWTMVLIRDFVLNQGESQFILPVTRTISENYCLICVGIRNDIHTRNFASQCNASFKYKIKPHSTLRNNHTGSARPL